MNPDDASAQPDDFEPFEVLMSGSGPAPGQFSRLGGLDAVFPGGRPSPERANQFLSGVVARHHELVDAFAEALRTGADSVETSASDLEESVMSLAIARSLLSPDSIDGEEDGEPDFHSEWLDDNLDIEESTPSEAEIPVTVELGMLLREARPLIRVREALVYSTGFVLTFDVAIRSTTDLTREERHAFDEALSELPEKVSISPDSGLEASPHSGWSRVFHRSAIGWGEVWVEGEPSSGAVEFRLATPFTGIDDDLTFTVDGGRILDARRRVIDVSRPVDGD